MDYLLVLIGGGIGSLCRFFLSTTVATHIPSRFPWGTSAVNVLGCFMMGLAMASLEQKNNGKLHILFATTGFLGAFTTFSTYGYEIVQLIRTRDYPLAFLAFVGCNALGFAAIYGGIKTAAWMFSKQQV